jgi:HSP20 family protein
MLSHRDDFLFPIESQFNKLFDQFFSPNKIKDSLKNSQGYPKMDVFEDEEKLMVKIALPGIKIEDISVEFNNTNSSSPEVTISGKSSMNNEINGKSVYYVKELRQSAFRRTLALPNYVKDEPEATLEDGILTLKWKHPEKPKETEPKKINIKQIKN